MVQLEFDPKVVSYEKIVDEFFYIHDPTTLNRQGPDIGDQYRSVVFFHSNEQEVAARKAIAEADLSGRWSSPVVTVIQKAMPFWPAEEYHQDYHIKHGGSCPLPGV